MLLQTLKKPKTTLENLKQILSTLQTHISIYPRFYLFTTFLFVQAIVVLFTRSKPLSLSFSSSTTAKDHHQSLPTTPRDAVVLYPLRQDEKQPPPPPRPVFNGTKCVSGFVYVYDLPSMFNKDLVLKSCDDLDPWKWQCGIISNDGFGKPATELAGVLPENLFSAFYRTNQFALELIIHRRMLNYKCRTFEPQSATAYYIPFYGGLSAGKFLWINDTAKRDYAGNEVLKWVKNQPYYRRSNGSDHFITLGRITWDFRRLKDPEKKWGSSFLNMPAMENITRFIIEKAPPDYQDVGVPYPTGFHPQSEKQLRQWQDFILSQNRSSLFTFIGATRGTIENDFRSYLMSYCHNESSSCRLVDCAVTRCSNGSLEILQALLGSDFCLQPKGDSYTRRSVFDCMVAGSVPVFFWKDTAYDQYQWFLPGEPGSYSVFIDHDDVRNGTSIKKVLESYDKETVSGMRAKVLEILPKIIYSWPPQGLENVKDAFDIAVEGVLNRINLGKKSNTR